MALSEPAAILARFGLTPDAISVHQGGHINASYRVTLRGGGGSCLLQRLNPAVFPDGGAVVRNSALVVRHLEETVARHGLDEPARRVAGLVPAPDGAPALRGEDGAWWRLLRFIEGACVLHRVETPRQAGEVGRAFGLFHALLQDYAGPPLEEPLPGFHDTARRLARLEAALAADPLGRAAGLPDEERAFVLARREYAARLAVPLAAGVIPSRLAHNDAKVANVLLDAATGRALAVVDLDTVMPGTPLYDVGDLVRSVTCATAEDHPEAGDVAARPELFAALAAGLLARPLGGTGAFTSAERALFVTAGLVLTYEQGIRFLTDHLEGDHYYRLERPRQNLDRARVQFRLLQSLEAQREAFEALVRALPA